MAEEIRQEFIFDAAKSLATISELAKQYEKLNAVLRGHAKSVKGYNDSTRKIVGGLIQIKNAAKAAADQLARVHGARAATKTTQATAAPPVNPAQVAQAKASLKELEAVAQQIFSGAAIKNQKLFKKSLDEMIAVFHRSGGSVENFKKKLIALDKQVNGTDARMRKAMKGVQKSTEAATNTKPLAKFTVSWKTMVRVVTTQLIVRGLNTLRQTLRQTLTEAIEFSRSIAEVATIANDAFGSLKDITKIVRETSDAFGKTRQDVAEGLYQTLSNQVGTASESLRVFGVANKLSIAAVGTTADAVGLLTATLNGFDISVEEANTTAAKLFKTVELGRTRMSELANTMGRVGPLANALGVSLDETLAAIATITVQGTKSAEALTQLRGVMQAMLKPSEDMKKVFLEVGVANAEAGIATFGFQGFLKEMVAVSGDSASEMGKLIRRVRGLLGAITLANTDSEKFIENLNKIETTTSTLLDKKFKIIFETDTEKLVREFNRIKNFFVVDLGPSLVKATADALEFGKSIKSIIVPLGKIATIIGVLLLPNLVKFALGTKLVGLVTKQATRTMIVGWLSGGASIKAATLAVRSFFVAMGPIGLTVAAIAALAAGLAYLDTRQQELVESTRKASEAQLEYQESLDLKKLELHSKLTKKIAETNGKEVLRGLSIAQKAYNENQDAAVATDKEIVGSARNKFKNLTDLLNTYVSEYERKIGELEKARISSEGRAARVIKSSATDRFERDIRFLDAQEKLDAQRARGLKLQREGSKLIGTGDPEKIKEALAQYKEAADLFGKIRDIANDQLGPLEQAWKKGKLSADQFNRLQAARRADNNAHKLSIGLANAQLKAEKNLQSILDARAKQAKEDLERQKKLNSQIKTQFDIILGAASTLDKAGNLLDPKDLENQAAIRKAAFAELRKLASKTLGGLDLAEQLQLARLGQDLEKSFSSAQLQLSEQTLTRASDSVYNAFLTGMNSASEAWAVGLGRQIGKALDPDFQVGVGFESATTGIVEALKLQKDLIDLKSKEKAATIRLQKTIKTFDAARLALAKSAVPSPRLTGRETGVPTTALFQGSEALELQTQISAGLLQIAAATEEPIAKILEIKGLLEKLGDVKLTVGDTIREFLGGNLTAAVDQGEKSLIAAVAVQKAMEEVRITRGPEANTAEKLAQVEAFIAATLSKNPARIQAATAGFREALGVNKQILANEKAITSEYQKQVDFQQNINNLKAQRPGLDARAEASIIRPGSFAMGGLIRQLSYFAKGNFARGTDTIPAMLSPGEYVMNSKSTRRFYSQLVAMNSGRQPLYRESGGSVTNISVGDINVQGGKNPAQTGRHIVGAIKRELRRGTSSF